MENRAAISRVRIRNYKGIESCDVELEPITFFVGPNGAGKSNFLEAIRFLSYAIATSLESAVDNRGGFDTILRKQADRPGAIKIRVEFNLLGDIHGEYGIEIAESVDKSFFIAAEECKTTSNGKQDWYRVTQGRVEGNQGLMPAASPQKLYLVNASGLAPFEPVYRALASMIVYNPVPREIRLSQELQSSRHLSREGTNLAEIVLRMQRSDPQRFTRVAEYIGQIAPGVQGIQAREIGSHATLYFRCEGANGSTNEISANGMSDGTLRALAILVALFQPEDRYPIILVRLEEPEAGLHPAATSLLFDALMEGSKRVQLLVTSHSPDLLDRQDISDRSLKAVVLDKGRTIIGPIDEAARMALRERLYTPGELLRMNQLEPQRSVTTDV